MRGKHRQMREFRCDDNVVFHASCLFLSVCLSVFCLSVCVVSVVLFGGYGASLLLLLLLLNGYIILKEKLLLDGLTLAIFFR